jgi:hypothetical protein
MYDWHYWVIVGLLAANVWVVANMSDTLSKALNTLGSIEGLLDEGGDPGE